MLGSVPCDFDLKYIEAQLTSEENDHVTSGVLGTMSWQYSCSSALEREEWVG